MATTLTTTPVATPPRWGRVLREVATSPTVWWWVASRAIALWLFIGPEHYVTGDVKYYQDSLQQLGAHGVGHTLVEYPVPALLLLGIPYWLLQVVGAASHYVTAIAVCAISIDALFLFFLLHARRWATPTKQVLGATPAEWVWIFAVPALGATAYARFDLIPGVLVGLAVLYAAHRPGSAAFFGALATSVKYWPALVLPAFAAPQSSRRKVITVIAATGLALAALSAQLGGIHRLFSPFSFERTRGLQIESVAATPAMIGWAWQPWKYLTFYSESNAYEIWGGVTHTMLRVSDVAMAALAIALVVLWARAWAVLRTPDGPQAIDGLTWLLLASVSGFIATGKVFSPQYLLWLLPAAAAGLTVIRDAAARRDLGWWSALLVVATAATHVEFPARYGLLLEHHPGTKALVLLLAARNGTVLLLFIVATMAATAALWRKPTRPSHPAAEPEETAQPQT